jgi:hypothetical protein
MFGAESVKERWRQVVTSPKSKPLVYIAGPYTNPDPVLNTRSTLILAAEFYEGGHVVPLVPHLTLLWNLVVPRPIEFWYAYDLELLRRCDALFRMPGESTGASVEEEEAHRLGLPVFTDREELLSWASATRTAGLDPNDQG